MTFKPLACPRRWQGVAVVLALILMDVVLVRSIWGRPVDGMAFIAGLVVMGSLLPISYISYRTIGAFTLEYWIDRDAVTLIWGVTRQVVPIARVQRVLVGTDARPRRGPRPWHWPCQFRSRVECEGLGIVNSYGTRPLTQQVLLITPGESYSLSPANRDAFIAALQERFALGVARVLQPELQRPPVWTWVLWRDRAAQLLVGAGLAGLLLMFGVLCFRFPHLSSDLPLHFDVSGLPDRIAPKSELFVLPLIGLAAWLFNTATGVWLYRHVQRGAAYLLWAGAVAVQGVAGLALFNLMRW